MQVVQGDAAVARDPGGGVVPAHRQGIVGRPDRVAINVVLPGVAGAGEDARQFGPVAQHRRCGGRFGDDAGA